MQFQFSFKHMETSQALTTYTETKLRTEIEKFSSKPVDCHISFGVDRHNHTAHCLFNGGDGFTFQVEHTCNDMYGSVDHMVDKLEVQLRRHKEKLKSHKGKRSGKRDVASLSSNDYENAEIDASDILKFEQARRRAAS
jgi:ribosomal subunit interface protein